MPITPPTKDNTRPAIDSISAPQSAGSMPPIVDPMKSPPHTSFLVICSAGPPFREGHTVLLCMVRMLPQRHGVLEKRPAACLNLLANSQETKPAADPRARGNKRLWRASVVDRPKSQPGGFKKPRQLSRRVDANRCALLTRSTWTAPIPCRFDAAFDGIEPHLLDQERAVRQPRRRIFSVEQLDGQRIALIGFDEDKPAGSNRIAKR